MRTLAAKPGFAPLLLGALVLAHLLAFALLFTTDGETVSFLGWVVPETCSWKAAYGVPCPTCGMTRGLLLTLQGRVFDAYIVNRSAPLLAISAFLVGLGLLAAGWFRLRQRERTAQRLAHWTQRLGLAGGGLWLGTLALHWALVLSR